MSIVAIWTVTFDDGRSFTVQGTDFNVAAWAAIKQHSVEDGLISCNHAYLRAWLHRINKLEKIIRSV